MSFCFCWFFAVLFLSSAVAASEHEQQLTRKRIVNGELATLSEFPFAASLLVADRAGVASAYLCAAMLLSDEWVASSAHCCQRNASSMDALFGTVELNSTASTVARVRLTQSALPGPFNFTTADLCLLKLSVPVSRSAAASVARPVAALGRVTQFGSAQLPAVAVGFGRSVEAVAQPSPLLKYATSVYLTNAACFQRSSFSLFSHPSILCSEERAPNGICNGDSGSGIFTFVDGRYVAVGVVSFFATTPAGCGGGALLGHTAFSFYIDWMRSVTGLALPLVDVTTVTTTRSPTTSTALTTTATTTTITTTTVAGTTTSRPTTTTTTGTTTTIPTTTTTIPTTTIPTSTVPPTTTAVQTTASTVAPPTTAATTTSTTATTTTGPTVTTTAAFSSSITRATTESSSPSPSPSPSTSASTFPATTATTTGGGGSGGGSSVSTESTLAQSRPESSTLAREPVSRSDLTTSTGVIVVSSSAPSTTRLLATCAVAVKTLVHLAF
jgi:secreted trypsin-like serine protease